MITRIFRSGDNYSYAIGCSEKGQLALIDPVAVGAILEWLEGRGLEVVAILNTHSHPDHTSGNQQLAAATGAQIMSHEKEQVPGLTRALTHGELISIGNLDIEVIHTPGHTMGGLCFKAEDGLYTGDTLFLAGCGNCRFGGNVQDMAETFQKRIIPLPDQLKVHPGHDYAATNLGFAATLMPDNKALKDKIEQVSQAIQHDQQPHSTIAEERSYNPFFRVEDTDLINGLKDKLELDSTDFKARFKTVRELRNNW